MLQECFKVNSKIRNAGAGKFRANMVVRAKIPAKLKNVGEIIAKNTSVFSLAPHSIRMLRYGSYRADGGGRRVFAKNRDAPFDQAFGAQGRSRSKQNE